MMLALHHFIRAMHHIIPQVIKTKFIIGAISDVRIIGFAAGIRIGLMFINTIYREAQPFEYGTVPLTIPPCQVVVHGYDMHPVSYTHLDVYKRQVINDGLVVQ